MAIQAADFMTAWNYVRRKGVRFDLVKTLGGAHQHLLAHASWPRDEKGSLRSSLTWCGGTNVEKALHIPPPPREAAIAMAALEEWLGTAPEAPPLAIIALAHAQFMLIQPFVRSNDTVALLLVLTLFESFGRFGNTHVLPLGEAFDNAHATMYAKLVRIRSANDWTDWISHFLTCVRETAEASIERIRNAAGIISSDRLQLLSQRSVKGPAVRLFESLSLYPVVNLESACSQIGATKPTANSAIKLLCDSGVLVETTGLRRDRVYTHHRFVDALFGHNWSLVGLPEG